MFRKLRAAFVNAVAWGISGMVWGAVTGLVVAAVVSTPAAPPLVAVVKLMAVQFGQVGFMCGALFSGALALIYRNSDVHALSQARVALLGAGAASLVPLGMALISVLEGVGVPLVGFLSLTGFCALFGAASASGLLRIAQGAPTELPEPDVASVTAG